MIPSLEPRLSSSCSSLAFRTVTGEKLDESLGSRLQDSSTTAAADVGGEYTSVRLAGQWGVASFSFALVSQLRWFRVCVPTGGGVIADFYSERWEQTYVVSSSFIHMYHLITKICIGRFSWLAVRG